jgi:hypothetical protein
LNHAQQFLIFVIKDQELLDYKSQNHYQNGEEHSEERGGNVEIHVHCAVPQVHDYKVINFDGPEGRNNLLPLEALDYGNHAA